MMSINELFSQINKTNFNQDSNQDLKNTPNEQTISINNLLDNRFINSSEQSRESMIQALENLKQRRPDLLTENKEQLKEDLEKNIFKELCSIKFPKALGYVEVEITKINEKKYKELIEIEKESSKDLIKSNINNNLEIKNILTDFKRDLKNNTLLNNTLLKIFIPVIIIGISSCIVYGIYKSKQSKTKTR